MKRFILAAAVALLALPAAAQVQEAFPSYIQVNGRAEREIAPDEFYLQIVINERDSKGKVSVESQQRDMIAALKRLGVNVEKQLKVANLSSEFFKKNTSVATAKYQLQLGSSAEVGKVWQALDGLGISNVSILKVSHTQIEQYKAEVRIEAMRNAKQNAATLAEARHSMPPRPPPRRSRSISRPSSCSTACRRNSSSNKFRFSRVPFIAPYSGRTGNASVCPVRPVFHDARNPPA